jgi:ATP-dependent RNA helicase RhlE
LIDLMQEGVVNLKNIQILVLDEADRMLDMGFAPQINKILATVPAQRQTLLFSATMPTDIAKLATQYMQLPLRVEVAPAGTTSKLIEQEIFVVPQANKPQLLEKLLTDYRGTVLIFSRTKHGARKLATLIRAMGHTADEIHANRSLAQRRGALAGFKSGKYRVLVATDIAARGIDVQGISLVINYDLPDNPDDYVHRIGRTGRASHSGKAISLATPQQAKEVNAIERVIRAQLPVVQTPKDLPPRRTPPPGSFQEDRPRRFGGGGPGGARPSRPAGSRGGFGSGRSGGRPSGGRPGSSSAGRKPFRRR